MQSSTHHKRYDSLLLISASFIMLAYGIHFTVGDALDHDSGLAQFSHSVFELVNVMWWGVALGILTITLLGQIPRTFVMSVLGGKQSDNGILRACLAGVLLDLCSHGILMVAAKLYERGASIGQVIAFLVASPWNSFSLTLILVALIGLPWTLAFICLSMMIAITTGYAFDALVDKGFLPKNPNTISLPRGFRFWAEARAQLRNVQWSPSLIARAMLQGLRESKMVLRWILFGIVLASIVRAFVPVTLFESLFAPTLIGLLLTMFAATVIEVCSEGSAPIAADIMSRAGASGNSFAFLMGGVATDYTEFMILKDTTSSWRIALALPLITLPQIAALAYLLNTFATPQ